MNPFPHRTSPHRAVIVLIVLGLGALVFQALQRAGDLYSAAGGESTLRRGDCVYQVFIDDIPLGVVCVDQPTSITALLEILGAKGEDRLVDHSRPIACNRIVRLSKASHEVSYEDLPGKVLLLAGKKIDVNTADADDLGAVPGLGTTLATRVTRFRDSFGPFSRMEELARVPGIGKEKVRRLQAYLKVGESARVNELENVHAVHGLLQPTRPINEQEMPYNSQVPHR